MAGSVSRELVQSQRTDQRWKMEESYWNPNSQGIEGMSVGQKYQQRNVFTSNGGSTQRLSLKFAVSKFQKRSFQIIFSKFIFLAKSFYETCKEIKFHA